MKSQEARQKFVDKDIFKIRRLFPKEIKEKFWKYFGGFFGRSFQEKLETSDFPITDKNINKAEYFIVVCQR